MSRERVKIDEDKRFKEKSKANKKRLTDATIHSLKPSDRQFLVWDEKQAGLCVLVSPGGAKSFRSNWVLNGKAAGRKLGRFPELSLAEARKRCLADRAKAQDGEDPRPEKAKAAEKAAQGLTVSEAVSQYINEHADKRQRTADQTEACLKRNLKHLWDTPINQVTKADLQAIIDRLVAKGTEGSAKQAAAWISACWRWCFKRDIVEAPIGDKIVLDVEESEPRKPLTPDELKAVWNCANQLEFREGRYLRLLVLMCLRFTELRLACWSEFTFDSNGAPILFTVPPERTKTTKRRTNKAKPYKIPITAQMESILIELRSQAAENEQLFHVQHQTLMNKVRRHSGVPHFSFHKLRNTFGNIMEDEFGYSEDECGIVLNHIGKTNSGESTGRYMAGEHLKRKRRLLDEWNQYVFDLVGIEQPEDKPTLAAVS